MFHMPIVAIITILIIAASGYVYVNQNLKKETSETSNVISSSPIATQEKVETSLSIETSKIATPKPPVNPSKVKLNSITPSSANSGEEIRLIGTGFGPDSGKVYFFNQIMGSTTPFMNVIPTSWSDTEIKVTIPPAVGGQSIDVEVVHSDGTKSNRAKFTIKGGQPRIDGFSPSNAEPLQTVTISGKEFGSQNGAVNIYKLDNYNLSKPDSLCQIVSWTDTTIKCSLPSTVNNGTEYGIAIESSDGRKSSFKYYKVGN